MIKVGVTERGDAGLDFSWVDKLFDANIIITKKLNDKLIEELINHKDKIIFHCTCTGFGNTILEPNVPNVDFTYNQSLKLIQEGFPKAQIVLRVDPIIPTTSGIKKAINVLDKFKNTGIKRVRFSFMDLYPHVKERFTKENIPLSYNYFTAPKFMRDNALKQLKEYENIYELESCAEETPYKLGCISQKDLDILKISGDVIKGGYQRKGCLCIGNKTELLKNKKKCPNGCLYCYWKG